MSTIIKNTTASIIFISDVGFAIPANSSNTIEPTNKALWADSISVIPYIDSGDIVINDGVSDLSPVDGVRFLKWPDRITLKESGVNKAQVVTSINVVGNATVTPDASSNGAVTINVGYSGNTEHLREVTAQVFPGVGPVDVKSGLLFIPDPENDKVSFLIEEIV